MPHVEEGITKKPSQQKLYPPNHSSGTSLHLQIQKGAKEQNSSFLLQGTFQHDDVSYTKPNENQGHVETQGVHKHILRMIILTNRMISQEFTT